MLERALNAPPRFSRRRFLATSATASLAFTLASQPGRLSADGTATESSGSDGGNPNERTYHGYLKFDPADGLKDYGGMGCFYQTVDQAPAVAQSVVAPNGYNPQNVSPPPMVRLDVVESHVVLVAAGPVINGRPGAPDHDPEKNLINTARFDAFPAVMVRYTQTPIVGGVPQTAYTSAPVTVFESLMPPSQWPRGAAQVDFDVTPPIWVGLPTELNETRGPNALFMGLGSGVTAPPGTSFNVKGPLGPTCRLDVEWTLAAEQKILSFHVGQIGFGTITIPPNVYRATFEWKFGILKWNLSTGKWDVQN